MRLLRLPSRSRARQVRALLAGGIVLGVGAVSTFASWTDTEFFTGTVKGDAHFDLQTSFDRGATWNDHATRVSAGALRFSGDVTAMAPGETVYAPLWVRTTADTSWEAEATLSTPTTSGAVSGFTYRVAQMWTGDCDAAAMAPVGGRVMADRVPDATPLDGTLARRPFRVDRGGSPRWLCVAITRKTDAASVDASADQAATVTWGLTAVPYEGA